MSSAPVRWKAPMVAAPRRTNAQKAGARLRFQTRAEHRHALGEDLAKRPGGYLHRPGYGNQPSMRSRACPSCPKWRSPGAIWRMRWKVVGLLGDAPLIPGQPVTTQAVRLRSTSGSRRRVVLGVGRKGKFLVAPLDDGQTLVAHLGMSGRFTVGEPTEVGRLTPISGRPLDDGTEIRFVDPRTFGFVAVVSRMRRWRVSGLARARARCLAGHHAIGERPDSRPRQEDRPDQGAVARPGHCLRPGQHLCR